jgi:signal transduction histidine kinase
MKTKKIIFYAAFIAAISTQESFSQAAEGYGLGLIICKNIVKAHGSRLKIWNDNGANFSFTLSELIFSKNYEQ